MDIYGSRELSTTTDELLKSLLHKIALFYPMFSGPTTLQKVTVSLQSNTPLFVKLLSRPITSVAMAALKLLTCLGLSSSAYAKKNIWTLSNPSCFLGGTCIQAWAERRFHAGVWFWVFFNLGGICKIAMFSSLRCEPIQQHKHCVVKSDTIRCVLLLRALLFIRFLSKVPDMQLICFITSNRTQWT